ncbi:THUMP domain-containing protein [Oscillatoria sp. CS-180]|uniref:THUMP domain-containing class I SAM-dependent RNA methyltransferase n=1 Tax=Oscillatoria sp. CS-180 TaxID=3021720 RepID=UPI00232BF25B|nr:THUMP domain-containing protein [Oscillatoria sp. CS-180]MDB9526003.1 THUMP domain-containing protein [Oscillatoria sp. CS-180]
MEQYFATVARGLEDTAAQELHTLGARAIAPGFCGVTFEGDQALLYRTNLWARLPFRILVKIAEVRCQDADELYKEIRRIDWEQYLTPDFTLAVAATGKNHQLNHTHFTALQVKNAIVDQQRDRFGQRSSVDTHRPDVQVNIHINRDRATVSLDSSGNSLHRRGYRPAVGKAPLKESLAAALIYLSGWQQTQAFCDPLCGSGTLPLEAALMGLNRAPGLFRDRFGFETWPDFDAGVWQKLRHEAEAEQHSDLMAPIVGCDRDAEVIAQAQDNARNCQVSDQVTLQKIDLSLVEAPASSGVVLCNPPYGERIGRDEDLAAFYKLLGDVLKQRFKGWTAFVLSGNKALARSIGLKSSQRIPVLNGNLPCQLMKYELY